MELRVPMLARRLLAPVFVLALACQSSSGPPDGQDSAASEPDDSFSLAGVPFEGDTVVFPPAPTRRERRVLPRTFKEVEPEKPAAVESPDLDESGHFEFSGDTVRINFNRKMQRVKGTKGPDLKISPKVKGKLRWSSPWTLAFTAAQPFDPDQKYSVELGELQDDKGNKLDPWKATFRADPRIWVAGKLITYIPDAGKPRVVAMRPYSGAKVGVKAQATVLFDQPVSPADVEDLVKLFEIDGKTEIASKLSHPGKDRFDGIETDKRHVIVLEPAAPLKTGIRVVASARDHDEKLEDAERLELVVADPLKFGKVGCGYDSSRCTWTASSSTLKMRGREFTLHFNNPIQDRKKAAAALKITPAVKNVSVWVDHWSAEGKISVSGAFEPSTTYEVSLGRVRDKYDSLLMRPIEFTIETSSRPASVSMNTGNQFLDAERSRAYAITSRNVDKATLKLWKVGNTDTEWREANRRVGNRETPTGAPDVEIKLDPDEKRDEEVKTEVDLLAKLDAGETYVAALEIADVAFSAPKPTYPSWSWAARPLVTMLTVNDENALSVHARVSADSTTVHVASLGSGEPIRGAKLLVDGKPMGRKTNAQGMSVINLPSKDAMSKLLRVEHDGHRAVLPLGYRTQDEGDLSPELASGDDAAGTEIRGMVFAERGIYRPGAKIFFKGLLRYPKDDKLVPVPHIPVTLKLYDPSGEQVFESPTVTNDKGAIDAEFQTDRAASIGRYRAVLEPLLKDGTIAETTLQVAEFEPPRFKVDVDAKSPDGKKLAATVQGRYLFGAAMDGASASWTLRRKTAPMPKGAMTSRLRFRPRNYDSGWVRTGEGTLDENGKLEVTPTLEVASELGPQRFTLEAEVTDSSNRAIAGRGSVVVHPHDYYAGVRLDDRWPDVGAKLGLELAVVDKTGTAVEGKTIKVSLKRIDYKRVRRPGPGSSVRIDWKRVESQAGGCTVQSQLSTVSCDISAPKSGSYELETSVDGHKGGGVRFWAWGSGGAGISDPTPGHRLELLADKGSYRAGEAAKVMVRNPFAKATAIFTIERGSVIKRVSKEIEGGPVEFPVPIEAHYAPHVHATVTLLPIGASGDEIADWKFGAIRLPVALDDARLDVNVSSDKDHYEPGKKAQVTVEVKRGGSAVADADVALAIVDEGVLRMTNYRAPDPVDILRPGVGLRYDIADTRRALAEMLQRSRPGGGGGGEGESSVVATRKNFVRTALWRPHLRTDASGKATVSFELPDNLTQFRMMAVVLDDDGRGDAEESHFEVRMPLMGIPIVPRFALAGDKFEAAIMVHNGEDSPVTATVALGDRTQTVQLGSRGRKRVSFEMTPTEPGLQTLTFSVKDGSGTERDRVEAKIPVQAAGIDERPRLVGTFQKVQEVVMEVPDGVYTDFERDRLVTVTVGNHMYPELGARMEYLIDYPHGCVEQTTSSTLPLLAARDILPRLGFFRFKPEQIDKMALAGLERLASMRTSSGGLAYWPGGYDPDVYGTAYAMRAVALADKQGIKAPGNLLEGMKNYLAEKITDDYGYRSVEVKASVALALSEVDALPESTADMLYDTVPEQGVFGKASLALALSTLPQQDERVTALLDELEKSFDETGKVTVEPVKNNFYYYGSSTRSRAQTALALAKLRPQSMLLPTLINRLISETDSYTTQSTAFSLIALREHVVGSQQIDAPMRATLDGVPLKPDFDESKAMGAGAKRFKIPFSMVAGRRGLLRIESGLEEPVTYMIDSKWRRPFENEKTLMATSSARGPEVYRYYSDAKGEAVDPAKIEPGQVVRVAVLARMPVDELERDRLGFLAMTDRIPAGFEPIQPDLWTVSRPAELTDAHPLYELMRYGGATANHVELRDDRVHLYFDRIWDEFVAGTYLMRATTPGRFVSPPAMAELMYEPDSTGYSEHAVFEIASNE